jgi:hypothetical protein
MQTARALHENGTSRSYVQSPQRTRAKAGEHPAAEEFPELVEDEAREPTTARPGVDRGDECREVCAHDAIEDARRRRAGYVDCRHADARSRRRARNERVVSALRTFRE